MSFLTNRAFSWLNQKTNDPAADKQLREQRREAKDYIRAMRNMLTDEKNRLTVEKTEKRFFKEEYERIKKKYDDGLAYLDNAEDLEKPVIEDYIKDNFDERFREFYRISKGGPNEGPGSGVRYQLRASAKGAQQALHDNAELKPTIKETIESMQKRITQFLNENWDANESVHRTFQTTLEKDFPQNSPASPEINKVLIPAWLKVSKNGDIDFEDGILSAISISDNGNKRALSNDKKQDDFSIGRLLFNASNYAITITGICLILFVSFMGSSFAVNLNIYKATPFKVLYAIYGFLFGLIVVPYVVFYRWLYKGKKPRYYGFMPFIPHFFTNPYIQFLLGWLTYRPDDKMWELQEWRAVAAQIVEGEAVLAVEAAVATANVLAAPQASA